MRSPSRHALGVLAVVGMLALSLAACGDDDPAARHRSPKSSPSVSGSSEPRVTVGKAEWTRRRAHLGEVDSVAVNRWLVVAGGDGKQAGVVSAWDRRAGHERWRIEQRMRGYVEKQPAGTPPDVGKIEEDQVALGSTRDAAVAVTYDATQHPSASVLGVAGLAPTTGRVAWTWRPPAHQRFGDVVFVGTVGDVLIVRSGAVNRIGCSDSDLTSSAIDLRTGRTLWHRLDVCAEGVADGHVLTDAGAILDAHTGTVRWRAPQGMRISGVSGDVVLVTGANEDKSRLVDISDPHAALPDVRGLLSPVSGPPSGGLIFLRDGDHLDNYAAGEKRLTRMAGVDTTEPIESVGGLIFSGATRSVILARDGTPLSPPLAGEVRSAGPDYVYLVRGTDSQQVRTLHR